MKQSIRRTLAGAAVLATIAGSGLLVAPGANAQNAERPKSLQQTVAQSTLHTDGVGGKPGWRYYDWYWLLPSCISAGETGQRNGDWDTYLCLPSFPEYSLFVR